MLKTNKSFDHMRLKSVSLVFLSFLRKLVRDEISLMSDSSAFQARGSAIDKSIKAGYMLS